MATNARVQSRAEKGLSITALIKSTPAYIKNTARDEVTVKKLGKTKTKGGHTAFKAICKSHAKGSRPHHCSVIGLDKEKPLLSKQRKVLVSCDCVTGSTKVLTDNGWKTIREIAEPFTPEYFPISYRIGDKVYAGSAPFFKGKQKVWRLSLSNGRYVEATKDHKFLVEKSDRKVWRTLGKIEVGDRMILNESKPENVEHSLEFYEAFFIGVMMGDGTHGKSCDLQLYKHDALEIFDLLAKSGAVHNVRQVVKNGYRCSFNHRAKELFARYEFVNKKSVRISNATQLIGYISGLLVTDGSVTSQAQIAGAEEYLMQLHDYLMEYGYSTASIWKCREVGAITNYGVSRKAQFKLNLGSRVVREIGDSILLTQAKQDRWERISEKKSQDRKAATRVVDITYAGRQDVYDITVPGPTRFVANGTIAHNCEFFMYYSEYALSTWGAARIKYSNGEPAVVKNPGNLPLVCKHLVKVLRAIKEHNF